MPVPTLTSLDPQQFFNLRSPADSLAPRLDAKVSSVAVSNDFAGRVSVTTVDGDTVTLSANVESDFRAVNYGAQILPDRAALAVDSRDVESTLVQEFGVAVEGDLNEQERHELERLFKKISDIFRSFYEGHGEHALAQTAKLAERFGSLSSLSSLAFNVDVRRTIEVLTAQLASAVPASTPGGAPATGAVIPQTSNGTTAPTPSSLIVLGSNVQQLSSLIEQVLQTIKEAQAEFHRLTKYLPDLFEKLQRDLLKELQGEHGDEEKQPESVESQVTDKALPPTSISTAFLAYSAVTISTLSFSFESEAS